MNFFKEKKEEASLINENRKKDTIEEFSFKVREPLNSISGIAEVLAKWIKEDYDKQQILMYMNLLKNATDDLQDTVNKYLTVTESLHEDMETSTDGDNDYAILKNLRIMVVEDSDTNSMIIKELLESYGAIVTVSINGVIAVERFTRSISGTYDIILMDINMPKMDGYEATDRIRKSAHPQARTIPIIATTADVYAEDVQTALKAGMNAHVSKPYNLGKIVSAIKAVL